MPCTPGPLAPPTIATDARGVGRSSLAYHSGPGARPSTHHAETAWPSAVTGHACTVRNPPQTVNAVGWETTPGRPQSGREP
jgi:hypothetical protein